MHTDPTIEELVSFVSDLCLDDASQDTEVQFDVLIREDGHAVFPAMLARGMKKEVWFRFDHDPEPLMEIYFKGPAWKAHFLLQRIKTGKVSDALGRDFEAETVYKMRQREAERAQQRDEDQFYDLLTEFGEREYERGYLHGVEEKPQSLWSRIKETINK